MTTTTTPGLPETAHPVTSHQLDRGRVLIDPSTGAPVQFLDDAYESRQYLLDSRQVWHSIEHNWGSGFLVTNRGATRWNQPQRVETEESTTISSHALGRGMELQVTRVFGASMVETYRFVNVSDESITITGLGIQTPFADVYSSAAESLRQAVHAHIFTGGEWAWALAQPMNGKGRVLGVAVRDGSLSAYSIESRNQHTLSNIRGHVVLQPTDFARNSTAFGGQPTFTLEPGEAYQLAWEIGFHESVDAFLATTDVPATFRQFAVPLGDKLEIEELASSISCDDPSLIISHTGLTATVKATNPGVYSLDIGNSRTSVAFHRPVVDVVAARANYILEYQLTPERPGLLSFGIVPVDTITGITQSTNGWSDWTDGSERIGMAIFLQQASVLGLIDDRAETLLAGWAQMAEVHLLDKSAAPRRGSQDWATPIRLYDSPWLAQFFVDRFEIHKDPHHLDLAARILERAFELGGDRFLAIGFSEACADVIVALQADGHTTRSRALSDQLVESARYFVEIGEELPEHEVNFEQSIVAPLINMLIDAYRITADRSFLNEIDKRLPWLLAFGGPQPHVRLKDVPIRHWDGYWFGIERLWGDVFPHYWSALTSTVLYRLPTELRSTEREAIALSILRSNMTNYFDDGSATCAFIMPSAVDGRPAHLPDRLANDQDWHLSLWLRMNKNYGAPLN